MRKVKRKVICDILLNERDIFPIIFYPTIFQTKMDWDCIFHAKGLIFLYANPSLFTHVYLLKHYELDHSFG